MTKIPTEVEGSATTDGRAKIHGTARPANATIEDALELAVQAHRGAKDKSGAPYIFHVLRVVLAVEGEEARMAAALHDVVEDTHHTLDDLRRRGFPERVVRAVDALTRRPGERYEDFVQRVASDPIARQVKLADLEDNMDIRRLNNLEAPDWKRLKRYRKAWELLARTTNGPTVRKRR